MASKRAYLDHLRNVPDRAAGRMQRVAAPRQGGVRRLAQRVAEQVQSQDGEGDRKIE